MRQQAYLSLLIIVSVFLYACQEEEKKPDYLLEEDRFVEVLTEFQLAEAVVRLGYHRTKDSMYYNDSIYQAVFQKVNLSEAEFDSNYHYYLERPKELEKIYEKVITNLSQRTAELEKVKEKKQSQADSLR
ncbi:MAG: DUF4296 domain-containing protein [Vicingaceae bacterium]